MKIRTVVGAAVAGMAFLLGAATAWADGTETLGPPSGLTIATGSGIVTSGVGMARQQPATMNVTVPGAVQQVLLYWEGHSIHPGPADSTIVVDGNEVAGTLIGGPTIFFANERGWVQSWAFRADITHLGLIGPGGNSLTVSGLTFDFVSNGAGLVVVYDDGTGPADISLRDGDDLAFVNFEPPLNVTVPQTFTFTPSTEDRTATLAILATSVASSNPPDRPNVIRVTIGGEPPLTFVNPLGSFRGPEFDSLELAVPIPAGADAATVQVFSEGDGTGDLPASLAWITAALSVDRPASVPLPDISVTKVASPTSVPEPGGEVTFSVVVTNHAAEPVNLTSLTDDVFGDLDGKGTCAVTAPPPVLAASGGTYSCSFTGAVTGEAGGLPHRNTVTAVGTDSRGNTDTDADTATVTFTDVLPVIFIDKAVDRPVVRVGDAVTYTYAVTNPGVEPLHDVTLTDDRCTAVTFVGGDSDGDGLLDATETWRYTCTTTLTVDTVNTATTTGRDDDGNTVQATDTASVVVIRPGIAIVKTANPQSGSPGQTITYSYVVTNPGDDPLSNVVLVDDKCSPVVFGAGDTNGDARLDPTETWSFSCSVTLTAGGSRLTNVATVTGTDRLGGTVSASDTETVTVVLAGVLEPRDPTPSPDPGGPDPAPAPDPGRRAAVAGGTLPRTGTDSRTLAMLGAALLATGAVMTRKPRRSGGR